MSSVMKMRLLLVCGVVMMVLTTLIVLYGFRKTEELRSDAHVQSLMMEPRTASFGEVPTGLTMGAGGTVTPAEGSAVYDDGLTATLVGIAKAPCETCDERSELVATIRLSNGLLPAGKTLDVHLASTALEWADNGYHLTLLDIQPTQVVFTLDTVPPHN